MKITNEINKLINIFKLKKNKENLFKNANQLIITKYFPIVGTDENIKNGIEIVQAIKVLTPYECNVKEINFYE